MIELQCLVMGALGTRMLSLGATNVAQHRANILGD